jgi:hypothetical protein
MLGLISGLCLGKVVVNTSTVDPAVLAEDLRDRSLQTVIYTAGRSTVGSGFTIGLALGFGEFRSLRTGFIYVAADLKISLASSSGCCMGLALRVLVLLSFQ